MITAADVEEVGTAHVDDDTGEVESAGDEPTTDVSETRPSRRHRAVQILAYGVLPALAMLLALGAGYLKYLNVTHDDQAAARAESTAAASAIAIKMLSYRPDTVQNDLDAAKNDLTGPFRESYSTLVDDVVAPGAIQQMITAVATVPASASVSATDEHAVVLLFIDQTVTIGSTPPSSTNSSVRATLDKIDGRWLISGFDPI
jgi:Mce-associated membrane protein